MFVFCYLIVNLCLGLHVSTVTLSLFGLTCIYCHPIIDVFNFRLICIYCHPIIDVFRLTCIYCHPIIDFCLGLHVSTVILSLMCLGLWINNVVWVKLSQIEHQGSWVTDQGAKVTEVSEPGPGCSIPTFNQNELIILVLPQQFYQQKTFIMKQNVCFCLKGESVSKMNSIFVVFVMWHKLDPTDQSASRIMFFWELDPGLCPGSLQTTALDLARHPSS